MECYDGRWFAFLPLVLLILSLFSLGIPIAIAYVLRKRLSTLYDDQGNVIPQPLDILYAIYDPRAYYYESVSMVFKLALWATLVFFDQGAAMQLGTALAPHAHHYSNHLRGFRLLAASLHVSVSSQSNNERSFLRAPAVVRCCYLLVSAF